MKNAKLQYWIRLTLFAAILLLMTATGLGYIKTPILNVTILTVPIAVAAITLGPTAGAVMGLIFGLTSAWSAISGSGGMTTLLFNNANALGTLALCILPRALMGWLCGLVYQGAKRVLGDNIISVILGSISAPLLNTVLFLGSLVLLFSSSPVFAQIAAGKSAWMFVWGVFVSNGIAEAITCGIIATAVSKALLVFLKKKN